MWNICCMNIMGQTAQILGQILACFLTLIPAVDIWDNGSIGGTGVHRLDICSIYYMGQTVQVFGQSEICLLIIKTRG